MTISKLMGLLVKKIWVLVLFCIAFTLTGFIISKFIIRPVYESTGLVYVSAKQSTSASNNDLIYSKSLVKSYIIIIKSDAFLEIVQEELKGKSHSLELKQLREMVKTSINEETFTVAISSQSPEQAYAVCASFLKNIQTEIPKIIDNVKDNAVTILNKAQLPVAPSSPNILLYSLIFFLIGGISGVCAILIMDKVDDRLKSENDLVEEFKQPILGIIYDNIEDNKGVN